MYEMNVRPFAMESAPPEGVLEGGAGEVFGSRIFVALRKFLECDENKHLRATHDLYYPYASTVHTVDIHNSIDLPSAFVPSSSQGDTSKK